jgi:hypothetical protein
VRRADEILAAIEQENPEVVFLSGLTPFGIARAHRLYRGVRTRFPHLRLMIGIWGYADDLGKMAQKISRGEPTHISTTLADAVAEARSFGGALTKPAEVAPTTASNAA